MKYVVLALVVIALLSVGLYFGLTYYQSGPKLNTNNSGVQSTPTLSVTPEALDETEPEVDLTALDRDLNESDNLESSFEMEFNKI